MQPGLTPIEKLIAFRERDKFSDTAWDDRGLVSSDSEICQQLTTKFNNCANNLIEAINQNYSGKQLKSVLKTALAAFNKYKYDTEEKEFIVDLFYELSLIVNVDFKNNLNNWLYGSVLTTLIKINKILRPDNIVETLKQPCSRCSTNLETYIMKKENGIVETSWMIIRCDRCNEFNLLSHGPNVKEVRFGNYKLVENLEMDEYTYGQALIRLEQIKFFRK